MGLQALLGRRAASAGQVQRGGAPGEVSPMRLIGEECQLASLHGVTGRLVLSCNDQQKSPEILWNFKNSARIRRAIARASR
jgi:hypothetical protein